jgi:hypothetical protein
LIIVRVVAWSFVLVVVVVGRPRLVVAVVSDPNEVLTFRLQ